VTPSTSVKLFGMFDGPMKPFSSVSFRFPIMREIRSLQWKPGAPVRARHSQFAGGRAENFGQFRCKLGAAVQIKRIPPP
jgi:hypothetical protein